MCQAHIVSVTNELNYPRMIAGLTQRHLIVRDGTRVGYQVYGDPQGPVIVLANGLGGTHLAFKCIYDALPMHRIVCWDYRGLYSSSQPLDPAAISVAHQVSDLKAILNAEGIGEFAMAGWSMGVQVCLQTFAEMPAAVKGLLLINGAFEHPFNTIFGSRLVGRTIPLLIALIRAQSNLAGTLTSALASKKALVKFMMAAGLVSRDVDQELFRQVASGFDTINWRVYSDLLTQLNAHSARDLLPLVNVPTAIITGDKDILTPPATATLMHAAIAGATLQVIGGGTHYTPIEYPLDVQNALHVWLHRIDGYQLSAARSLS
jgi:pimeloyl-ACP methyl ester carboxylesterase